MALLLYVAEKLRERAGSFCVFGLVYHAASAVFAIAMRSRIVSFRGSIGAEIGVGSIVATGYRSKNYYAQIYRDGRPCRISTGTDIKQEAQAFLRNLLTDADKGKAFVVDIQKITYGDL